MTRPAGPTRPPTFPLWAIGLSCLVVVTAGFGASLELAVPGVSVTVALLGGLGVGVPTALLVTVGEVDRRFRRMWSKAERIEFARVIRSGDAPADPEMDAAVLAMLARRRRLMRRLSAYGPWAAVAIGLAELVNVVDGNVLMGVTGLIFVAGVLVGGHGLPRRALDRIEHIETAIGERPSHQPESRDA